MVIREEIFYWIKSSIGNEFQSQNIDFDTKILEEGLLDSLGVINLVNWLEQKFAFEIKEVDFDMENFQTIEKISNFVEHNLAKD